MAHSVQGHLNLKVADYDQLIRQLVPAYAAMRLVQLELLALALPRTGGLVLDLGGGTGALAAAIAERFPEVNVEIWDIDPAMLSAAQERCQPFGTRVQAAPRSFTDPLPACDAVAACLSLHHVQDLAVKGGIYREIYGALRPGGIFVNADTAVPADPVLAAHAYRHWSESMRPHGITAAQAEAHFRSWSAEDYYPPLWEELRLLAEAGFAEPEVFWREGAALVFGARKPALS